MSLPFTLTNDSITVICNGRPTVVRKGAPNYQLLREAILNEDWDAVPRRLTAAKSIQDWAKGRFTVQGETVLFDGKPIPSELNDRIAQMASNNEDPTSVFNFWERLQKNPSMRSVQQLWSFLKHQGIPLTKDGTFLAYKGVRTDFKDQHSGQFDNRPGNIHEMPRNQISDDPNEACHVGFHVGALEYAASFSSRVVICEVDPADVVCIPYDHSAQKMRVSRYKVIGQHNGELLSDTSYTPDPEETEYEDDEYFSDEEQDELEEDSMQDEVEEQSMADDEPEEQPEITTTIKVPKKYAKLQKLDMKGLLDRSMKELRKYASQGLKIVGAYKIPGGKVALVSAILKARQ